MISIGQSVLLSISLSIKYSSTLLDKINVAIVKGGVYSIDVAYLTENNSV